MNPTPVPSAGLGSTWVRIGGTLLGTGAYCVYNQMHHPGPQGAHWFYDLVAGLAAYSFPAQLLAEGLARQFGRWWWLRLGAVVAMSIGTVGREFWGWLPSGHILTATAVAVVQSQEPRLPRWLRAAYFIALAAVTGFRAIALDYAVTKHLALGLLTGLLIGLATLATARISECYGRPRTPRHSILP